MELHRMTWTDAREALNERTLALLPVGSTEQHGPHLPLGTDTLTAEALVRKAGACGPWLELPSVSFGVSEHHRQFWGTLWIDPMVLKEYVKGIANSLLYHGVRRLVLVNGHGGNTPALEQAARELRMIGVAAYVFVWWRAIADTIAEVVTTGGSHAGEMETSAILALHSDLVHPERYPEAYSGASQAWGRWLYGSNVAFDTLDFSNSGCVGDPSPASAEKGDSLLNAASDRLHRLCAWLKEEDLERLLPRDHLP